MLMSSSDDVAAYGMMESHDDDRDNHGNDRIVEYFIHPPTSVYVYMTSASGDPFICPDCDYKTTVKCFFQGHTTTSKQAVDTSIP